MLGNARILIFVLAMARGLAVGQEFVPLGFLSDGNRSIASGISSNGMVAIGLAGPKPDNDSEAVFWDTRSRKINSIEKRPNCMGNSSLAPTSVSSDGSIIVGSGCNSILPAGAWYLAGSELTPIGDYPEGNKISSSGATGISADGKTSVGVYHLDQGGTRAYRWTLAEGVVELPRTRGASSATAVAVSSDASTIAGNFGPEAVAWIQQTIIKLGRLPSHNQAFATAVSGDGRVIVGASLIKASELHPFVWTRRTGIQPLARPPDMVTAQPKALSYDGEIIVGTGRPLGGPDQAILWENGNAYILQEILASRYGLESKLLGWTLFWGSGVSGDGKTIVGFGRNPNGHTEAFMVKLP